MVSATDPFVNYSRPAHRSVARQQIDHKVPSPQNFVENSANAQHSTETRAGSARNLVEKRHPKAPPNHVTDRPKPHREYMNATEIRGKLLSFTSVVGTPNGENRRLDPQLPEGS